MRMPPIAVAISNASLSLSPNRATMKSLAPGGWSEITRAPMAPMIEPALPSSAATSSPTPIAIAAAAIPHAAHDTRLPI